MSASSWFMLGVGFIVAAVVTLVLAEISDRRRDKDQRDRLDEWSP